MKKTITLTLAALALLATFQARAWTYSDGDLLLVFRKSGFNNIEFDLGSVSNYLGKANGYTTPVTGWDLSLVTSQFGANLTGVKVVLLATTSRTNASPTAWLSSAEPNTTAYNVSAAAWSANLFGTIDAIGNRPIYPYDVPPTEPNAYSIDPGGQYRAASYDYTVSGGNFNGIAKLGGNAPFTVEQAIPGFLDFWAIQPTTVYPNPPPDNLVGTFTVSTNGVLTFVAGPRPSNIIGVGRSGNVSSVQFTTTVGNSYSLVYTNTLGGAAATWPVDGTTLIGDGKIDTINRTTSDNAEFYHVSTQ
ncbi:MAG: hypothetical protein WAO02_12270 [Verrucomicrobiia bacterium]